MVMNQLAKILLISTLVLYAMNLHGQQLWWKIEKDRKEYSPKYYIERLMNSKPFSNERRFCLEGLQATMPGILYDTLKYYSKDFLSCIDCKRENNANVSWLLGLLELPDSVKLYVMNDTLTPLYVKARLGDRKAERIVLEAFRWRITNRKDSIWLDWGEKDIIKQTLYINTKKSKKAFVKGFRTQAYYYDPYLSSNSSDIQVYSTLLTDILYRYSTFYKNETIKEILTSPGYMVLEVSDDIRKVTDIKVLFKKLQKELRKEHKERVRIRAPYLRKASPINRYMYY